MSLRREDLPGRLFRRKRGGKRDGTWIYRPRGARLDRYLGVKDEAEAIRIAGQIEHGRRREEEIKRLGLPPDPFARWHGVPPEQHARDWIESLRHKRTGAKRVKELEETIQRFLQSARRQHLHELTPELAAAWISEERATGLSAETLNKRVKALKQFGRYLRLNGRSPVALFESLGLTPEKPSRVYVQLTRGEFERLAEAAPYERAVCYLLLGLTGLRCDEAHRLKWSAVDLEEGLVTVRRATAKNKKTQEVSVHSLLLLALGDLHRRRAAGENTRTPRGNYSRKPQGARPSHFVFNAVPTLKTFRADLEAADITWDRGLGLDGEALVVARQSLRGCFGSWLAEHAQTPLVVLQKLMRHGDIKTTMKHYARSNRQAEADALERVELDLPGSVLGTAPRAIGVPFTKGDSLDANSKAAKNRNGNTPPKRQVMGSNPVRGIAEAPVPTEVEAGVASLNSRPVPKGGPKGGPPRT